MNSFGILSENKVQYLNRLKKHEEWEHEIKLKLIKAQINFFNIASKAIRKFVSWWTLINKICIKTDIFFI